VKTDGAMFAALPQVRLWHDLRHHLQTLPGVEVAGFLTDGVIGSWLDFTFRGHRFTVNERDGSYQFFVDAADCAESILTAITSHCEGFLRI
jgi:hypothetical protein